MSSPFPQLLDVDVKFPCCWAWLDPFPLGVDSWRAGDGGVDCSRGSSGICGGPAAESKGVMHRFMLFLYRQKRYVT